MSSGFPIDDGISGNLEMGDPLDVLYELADEVRSYAQDNAPWTDQTGAARAGLDVEVFEDAGEVGLSLYHTVDYGLWLEVIQNGRFAIIMPTLEVFADEIFRRTGAVTVGVEGQ